jgi:hypothetical protein
MQDLRLTTASPVQEHGGEQVAQRARQLLNFEDPSPKKSELLAVRRRVPQTVPQQLRHFSCLEVGVKLHPIMETSVGRDVSDDSSA